MWSLVVASDQNTSYSRGRPSIVSMAEDVSGSDSKSVLHILDYLYGTRVVKRRL